MLRLRDIFRLDRLESGKQSNNLKAVATLAILLGIVSGLTALCIALPLWMSKTDLAGSHALLVFFAAILPHVARVEVHVHVAVLAVRRSD